MNAHIQQAGLLSGRQMTLVAVIGLHALVIAALIAIRVVPRLIDPGPPSLMWVPDVTPPDTTEPVPKLPDIDALQPISLVTPVIPLPGPITVESTEDAAAALEGVVVSDESGATGTSLVTPAVRPSTELMYRATRPTDDYYPSASVMLEERGIAVVRVCVDPVGRIQGQPTIQTSSGHRRLDQAAVRWARESLQFTPATVDGAAVAACKGFRVNFTLR